MSEPSIKALERGVAVLRAINQFNGAKPGEIAKATGIPRPSVYRLLKTLEEMELISRDHFSNRWRPTLHVKSLSSGYREEDWVCQIAVPHMIELGRDVLWPLDLVTLRNSHMEVRESTHKISPYSVNHGMVGRQLPLVETSSGRALLAYMPEEDRTALLNLLTETNGRTAPFMTRDGPLHAILAKVRELGVGYRIADFTPETGSISAPIWYEDKVFACLTLIWLTSAMPFSKGLQLYREKLLRTADAITRDLVGRLSSAEVKRLRAGG
ncbi:MAG: transcriptional regulator [Polymorphum sp.]|uniref:helix-turn-helix domain-containing protein n=1 Tax=Pannonibacter phragmitetus TaxID=121719 RepID=UPI000B977088|nr:helix-turn-helix domain-containing protein [Pannonibacter phragmitetus]MBA4204177.1 transcriptional regulator [Polymorphum sp.]